VALFQDGLLETFIGFRADLIDVGRPTLCQFRVVGRIPGARGKLEGFALLVPADIPPENIDGVGRARFVFGSGQPVQLVSEFLGYLNDPWNRFLWVVPRLVSWIGTSV